MITRYFQPTDLAFVAATGIPMADDCLDGQQPWEKSDSSLAFKKMMAENKKEMEEERRKV